MKDFLGAGERRPRVIKSFAANAGFWTLPSSEVPFPFGFGKLPVSAENIQGFLTSQLHVLLGERDDDENHQHLNRNPCAMLQGRNRLERGKAFYQCGAEAALRVGVKLGWTLEIVGGAGHSNKAMFKSVLRALDVCPQHSIANTFHASRTARLVWQDWIPPCEVGRARSHERRGEATDATSSAIHKHSSKDWHGLGRSVLSALGGANSDFMTTRKQLWHV